MSKIIINLDTETKQLSLSIDGQTYNDVREVCVYTDEYTGYEGEKESHYSFSAYLKSQKTGDVTTDVYLRSYANLAGDEKVILKVTDDLVIAEKEKKEEKDKKKNKDVKLKEHWSYKS